MFRRALIFAPVVLAVLFVLGAAGFAVWVFFAKVLLPPETVTIAAGREGSGYHAFAKRYESILAWDKIKVKVLETAGSVENAQLLAEGKADVAFIQGGIPLPNEAELEALAAVFLEPLLIFHRRDKDELIDPVHWDRLRIAAGAPQSGTRVVVEAMVAQLDLPIDAERLLPLSGGDAAEALKSGAVEAAIFVAPIDAPYLTDLLADPQFAIRPIRDAEALARRLDYVRIVDIPRSGLDYARQLPSERIELTAMVASLVAQKDLHPAVVNRLVRAAQRIHSGPSILTPEPEFPSGRGTELPLDPQAEAVLSRGPSALEAYLPYWVAAQITRVTVVLVPLIVLLLPILRATPGLLAWRLRSRVYRKYNQLVAIEEEVATKQLDEERKTELEVQLDKIDNAIAKLSLPPRYREYAYDLRLHLELVRRRVRAA